MENEKPILIRELDERNKDGRKMGIFKCPFCGNEFKSSLKLVKNGHKKSCSCLQPIQHGLSNTFEHRVWKGMKTRCYNKNHKDYKFYGNRGVCICKEWLNDFQQFYNDMGPAPSKKHSIHRKHDSLVYSKENCIWTDQKTQCRERRGNRLLTFNGQTKLILEWEEITGINCKTIMSRLDRLHWSVEKALTTPSRNKRN